jgi:molybdopterin-containing oxidoreductase family iron-sulfur binding subunit
MDRRDFLKIMSVASTATLMSSCGVERGTEKLIPFVVPPEEDYIPGEEYFYSSTCTECPAQCGVSVKVREFNPIKLEGLTDHPVNHGALCMRGQFSITRLYHPERLKAPLMKDNQGQFVEISWDDAYGKIFSALQKSKENNRKNVYLTGRTTGSLNELIADFCRKSNVERLPEYEAISYTNLAEANKIVFGIRDVPSFHIEKSDYLITLGADVFETFLSPVNYTYQLNASKKRQGFEWIHIEPHATLTGFQAREKLNLRPGSELQFLTFLLNYILNNNLQKNRMPTQILSLLPQMTAHETSDTTGIQPNKLNLIAQKLGEAKTPLLIVGGVATTQENGFETAVLAALLQWAMGMTESLIDFNESENYSSVGTANDVMDLVNRSNNNEVGVLFLSKTDLLSSLPESINLEDGISKASLIVGISDFHTPTTEKCNIVLPFSHSLESWGDAEPRKGLLNVIQPIIDPIHNTKTEGDILLNLTQLSNGDQTQVTYQEWLFAYWNEKYGADFADKFLMKGYSQRNVSKKSVSLQSYALLKFLKNTNFDAPDYKSIFYAVPSVRAYDGRSAILPLSSEIPDPLTTITYGQWVSISKYNAEDLRLKDRDEITLDIRGKKVTLPVKLQPGLAKNIFLVHLNHVDSKLFNVNPGSGAVNTIATNFDVTNTGGSVIFPILAGSTDQKNREIIPDHYNKKEQEHHHHVQDTLYPEKEYKDYRWSMSIDLENCIGCGACVAACYVENNIPVVGPQEHLIGREMSWIRVQPYYNERDEAEFLPMMCQQCGNAPCETVCPVFATYHNPEGLNAMVYNRCVGTRYCHNNCPYKVRRFNWFEHDWVTPMDKMLNPDVFVRGKGVMEKCTFCVQRIRKAKDKAKDENRKVHDGEITTACAQTCPAEAIVFGNILDHESEVYNRSQSDRKFRVLELIGTDPAVHYLRKQET